MDFNNNTFEKHNKKGDRIIYFLNVSSVYLSFLVIYKLHHFTKSLSIVLYACSVTGFQIKCHKTLTLQIRGCIF